MRPIKETTVRHLKNPSDPKTAALSDPVPDMGDPPQLRWLKRLVTGLAVVMGGGILAIVALLWLRLSVPVLPVLPASVTLPEGARAETVTFSRFGIVVLTQTGKVLIYSPQGALLDQFDLKTAPGS